MTELPATQATPATDGVIECELRIGASPETVFDFWVEPDRIVQWMGRSATIEPRPGGLFRLDYNGSDIASGEVVELDRPRRLVFTWGWEAEGDATPPGSSTIEVTLTADGDGTILRLRHSGLTLDSVNGHAEGWDQFLPGLVAIAEGRPAA
jgi:uncharacterized protein YndB with AHSA1/START domain